MIPSAKIRKLSSPVWEFFTVVVAGASAKCKLCDAIVKQSRGSTSGLASHLRCHHGDYGGTLGDRITELQLVKGGAAAAGSSQRRTVVPLDKSGPIPQRTLVSPVWEFFDPVVFRKTAKCKICNVIVKTSHNSTSGLRFHLQHRHRGHNADFPELRRKLAVKQQEVVVDLESDDGPSVMIRNIEETSEDLSRPAQQIRQRISPMWDFFVPVVRRETAKCKICDAIIPTTLGSTSGLRSHLQTRHPGPSANLPELRRKIALKEQGIAVDFGSDNVTGLRRRSSPVWNFFVPLEHRKTAKCKICNAIVPTTTGSTSGLRSHLQRNHPGKSANLLELSKKFTLKEEDIAGDFEIDDGHLSDTETGKISDDSDEEAQHVDPLHRNSKFEDEDEEDETDENLTECEQMSVEECEGITDPLIEAEVDKDVKNCQLPVKDEGAPSKKRRIKRRNLRSFVWKYFIPVPNRRTAKCKFCKISVKTTRGSTSGLAAHLKTKHNRNTKLGESGRVVIKTEAGDHDWTWCNSENKLIKRKSMQYDSELDNAQEDNENADYVSADADYEKGDPRDIGKVKSSKSTRRTDEHLQKETCFACPTKFNQQSVTQLSKKEYRFLLMEILELPIRKAVNYLEQLEEDETGISLCKLCQSQVKESISTREKITCLQLQLEKLQRQFLKKMKANLGKGKGSVKTSEAQSRIAEVINGFVQAKEYTVLDSEDCHIDSKRPLIPDANDYAGESDHHEDCQPTVLYCGLCNGDTVYESETLLSVHTKTAHLPSGQQPPLSSSQELLIEDKTVQDGDDNDTQDVNNSSAEDRMTLFKLFTKPVSCSSYQYRYDCPNCPKVKENTVTQFALHLAIHQKRPYQCVECSEFFPEDDDLKTIHWKDNHPNVDSPAESDKFVQIKFSPGRIWKCQLCMDGFFAEEDRDEHEGKCTHPANSKWFIFKSQTCGHCDMRFRNFAEWRFHRAIYHPEEDSMSCYYCDKSFCEKTVEGVDARNDLKMIDHMQEEHGTMRLLSECEPCGLLFGPGIAKTEHMAERHGIPANKVYPCKLCDMSYSTVWTIRRHMSSAHFQRSLLFCDMCGAKFYQQVTLLHHSFASHGIVPEGKEVLSCPEEGCHYKTILRGRLNVHITQVHEALRSRLFICKHCGKALKNRSYLRQHEDLHMNNNTKPFQCEVCGSSFAVKNYLTVHKKLQHEGRRKTKGNRKRIRIILNEEQRGEVDQAIPDNNSTIVSSITNMPFPSTSATSRPDVLQSEEPPQGLLNL